MLDENFFSAISFPDKCFEGLQYLGSVGAETARLVPKPCVLLLLGLISVIDTVIGLSRNVGNCDVCLCF
jgi:hypothetical protein